MVQRFDAVVIGAGLGGLAAAVQRGSVNTRWRDFGDVWTLAGKHSVSGDGLHSAIVEVAGYRQALLSPLHDLLQGYPAIAQPKWQRRRCATVQHQPRGERSQ